MTGAKRGGWVPVAVWAAVQLTLTSLPGKDLPVSIPHPLDWVGHWGLYGILGLLIARAAALREWPWRRLAVAALIVSCGAALDELHQLFIPGRSAEVLDWLSDTIGVTAGLTVGARVMASRFSAWLR
jgi:VanZ family protein